MHIKARRPMSVDCLGIARIYKYQIRSVILLISRSMANWKEPVYFVGPCQIAPAGNCIRTMAAFITATILSQNAIFDAARQKMYVASHLLPGMQAHNTGLLPTCLTKRHDETLFWF